MTRSEKIFLFFVLLILVLYPWIYFGYYAGDAIIHLVFGQNAALGHFFEFNFGEKSSGESSVAYMLFIGLFFKVFSAKWIPVAVKIFNYCAWLLLLFLFYRLLLLKKINAYVIGCSLLAIGLLPGSVYNSMNGMENGLFALYTLLWFCLAIKCSYFTLQKKLVRKTILNEIICGLILGMGVWLRPEALPFFAIVIASRFFAFLYYKDPFHSILGKTLISLIGLLLSLSILLFFIHRQTGMWIQSSVIARTLLGRIDSYHLGIFAFDPKFLIRLIAYLPITFFWVWGTINFFKFDWKNNIDEFFAIVLLSVFIFLFTLVNGAAQLGRYMIFLTPFWILIAARGAQFILSDSFSNKRLTYGLSVWIVAIMGIYSIETMQRFKLGLDTDFLTTINSIQNKQELSDELYTEMGSPKLPIILAGGEVDHRYRLDNRFIIRCLDGRIDPALLKYFHRDSIDYLGYLKERGIDYFMLDYSIPSFKNTLPHDKLKKLRLNEHIDLNGFRITFIGTRYNIYKIESIVSTDKPIS